MAIIEVTALYDTTRPSGVAISKSNKDGMSDTFLQRKFEGYPTSIMFIPDVLSEDITYYVWAKYDISGKNLITMRGFFIRK